MEQLDLLWDYQELDILLDGYEAQKKNSALRHKLVKLMNYLKDQQDQLVKLNDEADKKSHVFNRINHEFESIKSGLKADVELLDSGDVTNLKQLDQIEKKITQIREKLSKKEGELSALLKDMDSLNDKLQDIRIHIAKGKKEYTKIKQEYDAEVEKIQAKCVDVKGKMDQLSKKIDKALINKYNSLRKSHSMAVALIDEGRCGGCNMSLAALVIQKVKDQNYLIECENCGRILYAGPKTITS